jgi:hypothetical protein
MPTNMGGCPSINEPMNKQGDVLDCCSPILFKWAESLSNHSFGARLSPYNDQRKCQ